MSSLVRRTTECGWDIITHDRGSRIQIDYAVSVLTTDGFEFRIEGPFMFIDAAGCLHMITPEGNPRTLSPVLAIARTTLARASAFDDGRLELDFADGAGIRVGMDEDFEAWGMTGPGGMKLVSMPGGKLAVWS
ncbi:MAG: DUF6188 family protein [Propionibacteriaceae bacterium]